MDIKTALPRRLALLVALFFIFPCTASAFAPDFKQMRYSHDLRLPDWGPYTDKYAGISHIPAMQEGARFDVSVVPGIYRRMNMTPNVRKESGYHPWDSSADMSFYSYRYELEWKDELYADVSFAEIDESSRLIRTRFVNNTDLAQTPVLHYMLNMNPPSRSRQSRVSLPEGGVWINGVPYYQLNLKDRPAGHRDSLMQDGRLRGETGSDDMVFGRGLGSGFGEKAGDEVVYRFNLSRAIDGELLVRHRNRGEVHIVLGGALQSRATLPASEGFRLTSLIAAPFAAGEQELEVWAEQPIEIDGFALVKRGSSSEIQFEEAQWGITPKVSRGPSEQSRILEYPGCEKLYGFAWKFPLYRVRHFLNSDLEDTLAQSLHSHVSDTFRGDGRAHYENIYLAPIAIDEHSERQIDAFVCYGDEGEVAAKLRAFCESPDYGAEQYAAAEAGKIALSANPAGADYLFSQQRMASTLLGNCYYPVSTQGRFIRHYQPGKWWLSLYTWDAGFAGIGLVNVDVDRSVDLLNTYTTEPGSESAFIHHGTPLPVQAYQYLELWNKTQSKELLAFYYPRIKQMHDFLMGRYGTSTTRRGNLYGLIQTWDYFYNSGGWDDYPPQVEVHRRHIENSAAPVVSSAHLIRTAKILKAAAEQLGLRRDIALYERDIASLSDALQKYSWDEESGYFGYVTETDDKPEILRTSSGENFNKGLGGIYPLVAGIGNEKQNKAMLAHLQGPELRTPIGLSTVDRNASYYRPDGYWNGAVWMPHQWFFWKAMFDYGDSDTALYIARTALELWKKEVGASYNCFEHFLIETGRGAGWHQFGALSGPVTHWFAAMYRPGTVTTGYDTWLSEKDYSPGRIAFKLDFYESARRNLIWVCMDEAPEYNATIDGRALPYKLLAPGLLEITVQNKNACRIEIKPAGK
ncbi:MAG: trehalase family glycosidase [Phycisphaerae bacterium]